CKPAPTVTWYRGTTVVKETKRISIRQSSDTDEEHTILLEIEEPSVDDGGIYKCHLKNEHGETNANLNLNIEGEKKVDGEAPSFVEKPKIIPEDDGKRIIMECKVKAKPKPTITWYHGSTVVKETNRIKINVVEAKDVYLIKLELKDPSQADAGIYKCNVKNEVGESNANLTLNVELAPPIIKERPKVVRIERHRRIVLECIVQSKNKPECLWYHEDNKVREDRRKNVIVKEVDKGEYQVSLEIERPDNKDLGSYKLVAKNDKGESVSQVCEVDLPEDKKDEKEKGEKPKMEKGLTSQRVKINETAEFICKVTSSTKTTVIWYKGGRVLRETREITQTFDSRVARMTIRNVQREMAGTYKVEITNEFGSEVSSCELSVVELKKKVVEESEEETEEESEEEPVEEKKKPEEKPTEKKKPEEKPVEKKKPEEKPVEKKKPEEPIDRKEKKKPEEEPKRDRRRSDDKKPEP
ncbi:unc-22 (predicted), partial [Pycnogonum litorale]